MRWRLAALDGRQYFFNFLKQDLVARDSIIQPYNVIYYVCARATTGLIFHCLQPNLIKFYMLLYFGMNFKTKLLRVYLKLAIHLDFIRKIYIKIINLKPIRFPVQKVCSIIWSKFIKPFRNLFWKITVRKINTTNYLCFIIVCYCPWPRGTS